MPDFTSEASEGILDFGFSVNDAVEPELIPEGDYRVKISRAEMHKKKDDPSNVSLHVVFKALDATELTNPNPVHKYFGIPNPNLDDEEKLNNKKLAFKRFFDAFGIDSDGPIDLASLDGLEGEVHIGIQPAQGEYGPKNQIDRFGSVR